MKRLTLVPAYGRDYKSKAEVQADLDAGQDFLIQDISCQWDGKYAGKQELVEAGYTDLNIRYKRLTQVAVIKL